LRIFDQIGLVHLGVGAVFDGFPESELDRLRIDGRDRCYRCRCGQPVFEVAQARLGQGRKSAVGIAFEIDAIFERAGAVLDAVPERDFDVIGLRGRLWRDGVGIREGS
jgi:hypothetical protein